MNILDKKISFYKSFGSLPEDANLFAMLTTDKYRTEIEAVREKKLMYGDEEYKKAKQRLPMLTVSGTFAGGGADTLLSHSGLICIDIDEADNTDVQEFDQLKEKIKVVPYVAYCGHSVGGAGYFAVIPISRPEKHKEHFSSLYKAFKRCGITIDRSGSDVSRKRFVSFDPDPYINVSAMIYDHVCNSDKTKADRPTAPTPQPYTDENKSQTKGKVLRIIAELKKRGIDITVKDSDDEANDYDRWFRVGCALATEFGDEGRSMFHDASSINAGYSYDEADRKYNDCMRTRGQIGIGTFIYYANKAGILAAMDFDGIE